MKKEYTETIPRQEILHKLIICDNSACNTVIEDNGELLEEHQQVGFKMKLLDCCSEKCVKILSKKKNLTPLKVINK